MTKEPTLEEMAREYVDLVKGPSTGWAFKTNPTYTQSLLTKMSDSYGITETNKAIDAAHEERRLANFHLENH